MNEIDRKEWIVPSDYHKDFGKYVCEIEHINGEKLWRVYEEENDAWADYNSLVDFDDIKEARVFEVDENGVEIPFSKQEIDSELPF